MEVKLKQYNVAIVGVTGAVGQEFLNTLERRDFPVQKLVPLASARSAGKKVSFKGNDLEVQELTKDSFAGIDFAFFSAGAGRSLEFAPYAVKAGAVVIDNSSAFRMDEDIPLVVPEVNSEDAFLHKGIIANPNCSTIQMVVALNPIHKYAQIDRVVVSTYQAVSGTGVKAMQELDNQVRDYVNKRQLQHEVYPHQIAFNVIPHVDVFFEDGYTKEEMKMVHETKKIMHAPNLNVTATCVRVPVFRAHAEAVNVSTQRKISRAKVRDLFSDSPGIKVVDDPKKNVYPLPLDASGDYNVWIGRIREDISQANGIEMWVVADQLLKGAALNAIQIAEVLIK